MIRVLIAEDSATTRAFLTDVLHGDPDIVVVGQAANGAEAVDRVIELAPDLVIMDVHMPIADGLEATKEIMIRAPTPIIIVSSSLRPRDIELSLSATQAGALMALPKPGRDAADIAEFRNQIVRMTKAMSQVKVVRRWPLSRPQPHRAPAAPVTAATAVRLVAIAASTGGPGALRRILVDLPRDFPAPILVVQHIARGFAIGFADWLGGACSLPVKVARHGEPLRQGTVYIAGDDSHLGVDQGSIALSPALPIDGFRPSATHLFDTAARSYPASVAAVVLTGMGSDGVAGLEALRAAGGCVIAQDEASSVVYGMAQEAVRRGLVDVIVPIEGIAPHLLGLVSREAV